jgi:putative peptidoglycan lipid II flippase
MLVWLAADRAQWWLEATGSARALRLTGVVALGAGGYFATLWLLGFRLRDFVRRAAP